MKTDADIIVIGAGPAGLSFCKSLEKSGLSVIVIERSDEQTLASPAADGREIALTHLSKEMLSDLGAWDYLSDDDKYYLRQAKVLDGDSPYTLHFPTPDKALGKTADTLGYLISNHKIRESLYAQVKPLDNVSILAGYQVSAVNTSSQLAQVTLADGQVLHSQLIVAADSRLSQSRRQMGISTEINDFGRTVIVFRMNHSLSNEETACECFHYGRTLAVLPLTAYCSSIVVTIDSSKADDILQMTAEELRHDTINQLDAKLGDMHLEGKMYSYPLVGVHANQFYAKRYALIGDAAVGMHPVTAHGFNLGLQGQSILSQLIMVAQRDGQDIASTQLLQRYSRRHRRHTFPLYHGTNIIVKMFTTETLPAKLARKAAIRAGNLFMPFKKIISKQLTG